MLMELIIIGYLAAALLGLALGSFSGATVWRLRARQLAQDKAAGEEYDKAEFKRLKPLMESKVSSDRSRCLHCHHTLAWYDLLPLVSWLSTRGKCRYCKEPIGNFEPLIELGSAALFVTFYHYWILTYSTDMLWGLILWALILTMFVILFAYDSKWFLLPDVVAVPLILLATAYAGIYIITAADPYVLALSTVASVTILSGLYLVLWLISRGAWVGFGDVKLGLVLGLLLMDWRLALLTLFLANFIGTIIVLPGLVMGKLSRGAHIPFGPLLIAGFFIALIFGNALIDWYLSMSTGLTNTLLML